MDNNKLATELLKELKTSARRWFVAFLVVLVLWFATVAGFIWYVNKPTEQTRTTVGNEDGVVNFVGGDGEISNTEGN